jgi:hypothetical protein
MITIPSRIAYWLVLSLILLSNLNIGEAAGIRLSAAVLYPVVAALIFALSPVRVDQHWLARALLIILGVALALGINYTIAVDREKFQMPALNFLANTAALIMLHAVLRSQNIVSESVLRGVQHGTLTAAAFGILQFVVANSLGPIELVFYPFADMTYELRNIETLSTFAGLIRLQSIFYEPSIAGQMFILGIVVTRLLGQSSVWKSVVYWSALALTFSVTALLSAAIMGTAYAVSRRRNDKGTSGRDWISLTAALLLMGALAGSALFASSDYNLLNRLYEIVTPGTSGYHRVVTPILFIRELLASHPLGVGVGCIDEYIKAEWMRLEVISLFYGTETSLITVDNVFIAWMSWFGLPALIPIGLLLRSVSRCLRSGWPEATCVVTFLFSVGNTTFFYVPIFLTVFLAMYSRVGMLARQPRGLKAASS